MDKHEPIRAVPWQVTIEEAKGSTEVLIRKFKKKCKRYKPLSDHIHRQKTPKPSDRKRLRRAKKNPDGWR